MRSAEEVTREVVQAKTGLAIDRILTEWQAEVAEQVRAEVDRIALTLSTMTTHGGADAKRIAEAAAALVGLEWETRSRDDGYAGWASGQGLIAKPSTRERRLVGPWEPEP